LIASLRNSRAARATIALVALVLVLAACGSSSKDGSGSSGTSGGGSSGGNVTLNGSGSTFQKNFNEAVIAGYTDSNKGTTINYAGGGSGKGKTDLQTKTVDFAGTDSLIKDEDLSKYQGGKVLYFPTVAAPITVSYNLSGVDKLQLSGPTLAKIFSGSVKKWNDDAIKGDNPGANLPDTDITIVHRSEASGTTSNFTKYLASAGGSAWTLGSGDTVNWPSDAQAGTGNTGVAQVVKQTDGAIGYVDYSDAKASGLKFASIKNKAGNVVEPTLEGAAAAVDAAKVKDDLTYSPIDTDGAQAYPITSRTWIILYEKQTDKAKGTALKSFLTFALGDGQQLAAEANYAALPSSLQQKAQAALSQIQIPA
jgi:phosphate transport system substrate-binding protein